MDMSVLSGTLVPLVVLMAIGGAAAGLLAGMFGVGGGAIIVPVLYSGLETLGLDEAIRMHVAVGTSLGIIVPTAIRSFRAHLARGGVDRSLLRLWILPVIGGVVVGTVVAAYASATTLKMMFIAVTCLLAIRMLFGNESWRLGNELPGQPLLSVYGAGIGFFSVMIGVGGGILSNAIMSLYGRPLRQAVATASGLGILISIPGMTGFILAGWSDPRLPPLSLGYVSLIGVALVMPIAAFAAPFGVRLAHRLPKRVLEAAFGVFLMTVAANFLSDIL